ncbi:hypothetical protein RHGRI_021476 [Rhododendron griersonianum]|uniref:Gnk2-homologous domain-containing protein n=1 Tax=Rhododendron griersonianum TaxID=479676 RepID=A0AAV6JNS4_9ERIC|nr:hypothetical protein RHGRI_021476 [Rhododendron griersonianum]
MGSWRELLFLHLILLNIVGLTVSQPDFLSSTYISESGNYSTDSTYQTNLETLLSSLSSRTDRYGFYSSSVGDNPDIVNAIVLCRGDVDLDSCHSCIDNATMKLPQLYPNYKAAIGWYDYCMLRYSDKSIKGILATYPLLVMWNVGNASSVNQFNWALGSFLGGLRVQAASGGDHRKFETENTPTVSNQTIYGLMQCTPDLNETDCNDCLQNATDLVPQYLGDKIGGRILTPSCTLRYETYQFFAEIPADAPADAPPDAPTDAPADAPPTTSGKHDNTTRTVIIIVVSTIGSVIGFIVCVCIFLRKRKQKKNPKQKVEVFEAEDQIGNVGSLQYDFETISIATNNFSNGNKLGQGGFGAVYQAWDLWREGNALDIVDPFLRDQESFPAPQVLR